MTVWCHLYTIFTKRLVSFITVLLIALVALTTTLFFAVSANAQAGVNQTINFQGRLLSKTGGSLPDGYYNIQFKIYQDGEGNATGNPGGTLKWTESYTNNSNNEGVLVRNSLFSVNLGSSVPFGNSVDWNQSKLWLSLNVAGSAADCSSFGTTGCAADGEMLPMKRITASPYALNSGALGGKTANNFIQLSQGVQTDASTNSSSIFINKTGTGNLVQLQTAGSNVFSVTNKGDIEFGNGDTRAIYIGNAADSTNGNNLVVHAGYGGNGSGNIGGGLFLQGGGAGGDNAEGGSVAITGGVGTGTGKDGSVYIGASDTDAVIIGSQGATSGTQAILIGNSSTAGGRTNVTVGSSGTAAGGTTTIQAKDGVTISTDGSTRATFNTAGTELSGNVNVQATDPASANTFQVQNTAGDTVFNVNTANNSVSVGSLKVSAAGNSATSSLWDSAAITSTTYNEPSQPINLGTTFKSDVDGYVTGVKFYNPAGGNALGSDVGRLWACANASCALASGGTELAAVNFPSDTTAGWKTATFSTPVHITANTYYIVTYYSAGGIYTATSNYFVADHNNAPLHAMSSATTQNGSFNTYGPLFPTGSYNNTNYWVDVAFQQTANTDTISTDNDLLITSEGSMTVGPTSNALTLQGASIDIGATNGGNVTMQGGNATISNGNGGSILLTGGTGMGTGADGLVVMTTPTLATTTNDANCYTNGALVATSCTLTAASINSSSSVIVGFSAPGQTLTLPDPTNLTAGRLMYLIAAGNTQDFTLSINEGAAGVAMRKNTAVSFIWNGADWISTGSSSTTTLQDAYNNSQTTTNSEEVVLTNRSGNGVLTLRDNAANNTNESLFKVQSASATNLLTITGNNSDQTEFVTNGDFTDGSNLDNQWISSTGVKPVRITTDGYNSTDSLKVDLGTGAYGLVLNLLTGAPSPYTKYHISLQSKLFSGSPLNDLNVYYSPDGGASILIPCGNYLNQTVVTDQWSEVACDVTTEGTAATQPSIFILQPTSAANSRTILLDAVSFKVAPASLSNVKIGNGAGGDQTTVFTLDKSAVAPTATDSEALLGSMYYDTTLGKVQCYEADGWGACGASPDTFVSLSPEYSNAVTNGTGTGTMTSDFCSDTLNVNDGSSSQPTVCGTNEMYNFYKWTSPSTTAQTKSIFVTYQLPANFDSFVPNSISLMGRTSHANATVTYEMYVNRAGGAVACTNEPVPTSTGAQTTWQQKTIEGYTSAIGCAPQAGETILLKVNLTASNNANAYASNLNFAYSTKN